MSSSFLKIIKMKKVIFLTLNSQLINNSLTMYLRYFNKAKARFGVRVNIRYSHIFVILYMFDEPCKESIFIMSFSILKVKYSFQFMLHYHVVDQGSSRGGENQLCSTYQISKFLTRYQVLKWFQASTCEKSSKFTKTALSVPCNV